jgi:hypothetical protein
MSIYIMMAVGLYPFGSLIAGAEAQGLGVRNAQVVNAAICLIIAVVFKLRLPYLRMHHPDAMTPARPEN